MDYQSVAIPLADFDAGARWDSSYSFERGPYEGTGFHKRLRLPHSDSSFLLTVEAATMTQPWPKKRIPDAWKPTESLTAYVNFNPSRCVDGPPWALCPVDVHIEDILPRVYDLVTRRRSGTRYVEPAGELGDARVTRLDVAQNIYEVTEPGVLLQGLAPLHRPYAKRNVLEFDSMGIPQTLWSGSGGGRGSLYDKTAELMSNGPWTREPVPDLMRWEVQAHEWAGQYGGIDTVADLSPASVRRLYDNRSAWFQVERIIVRRVDFIALLKEAAQHDRELTAQTQLNLVEYCWQLQDGEEPEVHRNTRTKYNRILARHGIAPLANFNGRARHIDLEAGCQRLVDTSKVVSLADYARRRSQAV